MADIASSDNGQYLISAQERLKSDRIWAFFLNLMSIAAAVDVKSEKSIESGLTIKNIARPAAV